MKIRSSKSMLSQYAPNRLSEDDLDRLHRVLLHMLKDLKACCDRHGLKYMLSGGTCLGAVRHKGFIPWDDDIDIMMPRADFKLLADAIREDYGPKYSIIDVDHAHIINILLNGTVFEEVFNGDPDSRRSIYIDVFPIDNMPKGKCSFRAFRFYWAKHACAFIRENKYPSPFVLELEKRDKAVASYYGERRLLGKFFRVFGTIGHYNKIVNKLAEYKKETGYLGIPTAIAYNREKFKAEVLTETTDAEFCGDTFKIPAHYDEYLTNLYGADYMTPPPPEKREVHVSAKIEFGIYDSLNENGSFTE